MPEKNTFWDLELQYKKMIKEIADLIGQDAVNKLIKEEDDRARQTFETYAFENSENIISETTMAEEVQLRKWAGKAPCLTENGQKTYDSLNTVVRDTIQKMNQIQKMDGILTALSGHLTDFVMDYRISNDEKAKMETIADKVDQLNANMDDYLTKIIPAKKYGSALIDALLGNTTKSLDTLTNAKTEKEAWDNHLKKIGYSFGEHTVEQSPAELMKAVLEEPVPNVTEIFMDIQSYDNEFGAKFTKAAVNDNLHELSEIDRVTAAKNFDILLEGIFTSGEMKKMEMAGTDVFDYMFVDGKSMNELYAEKYADRPYYSASQSMKCEFMADLLKGKQIDVYKIEDDKEVILPIRARSKMPEIRQMMEANLVRERKDTQKNIRTSIGKLSAYSKKEITDKRLRMAHNTEPHRINPKPAVKSDVFHYTPVFRTKAQHECYLQARGKEGKMLGSGIEGKCSTDFLEIAKGIGYDQKNKAFFQQNNIMNESDLFYIDGIPAKEYVDRLYPNKKVTNEVVVQAEILAAAMSGKHRVEAATIGVDEKGNYQIGVAQIIPDLSDYDKAAKFYQKKPSAVLDKLYQDDTKKDARQESIRADFSQKLAKGINRAINQREEAVLKKIAEEDKARENQRIEEQKKQILLKLGQASILHADDVQRMFTLVTPEFAADSNLSQLVEASAEYDSLFRNNRIPSKDDPDFAKKTAEMNQKMMTANETLLVSFMDASADYLKKWSDEKEKTNGNPELAKQYENMGVCLKMLAENMQAQKIKLTNLYDQTMETYRNNPDAMEQLQGKSYADLYTSQTPYQKAENTGKKLGQGAMNTVYKVEVDGKERVFKEGHVHLRDLDNDEALFFRINVGVQETNFEYGDNSMKLMKDVYTANRDVAMSRVDKLFGLGIVVDTKLVRAENGELSSLMDFANGFTVQSRDYAINDSEKDLIKSYQLAEYPRLIKSNQSVIETVKRDMEANPEFAEDYQHTLDERASLSKKLQSRQKNEVISIREQSLNKGLMNMAALDYICSHTDRHLSNYMIEERNGQFYVHAIDNDTAFKNRDIDTPGTKDKPIVELEANFPFVTAELKEKIDAVTPDMLRNSLEGLLSKEQIDISCQRLKMIQDHFSKIPVVEGDFTEKQLDQLLDPKHALGNYNAHLAKYALVLKKSNDFAAWENEREKQKDVQKQQSVHPSLQPMGYKDLLNEAAHANETRRTRQISSAPAKVSYEKSGLSKSGPEKK